MEPLHEVQVPEIDYMKRLQDELASCCMPSIKDIKTATTDEITRDTYRVLTGNGNVTGGLIVKIATANVNITNLKEYVAALAISHNAQIARCNEVQKAADKRRLIDNVQNKMLRTAASFVWENKSFIVASLAAIGLYLNSTIVAARARAETFELVKQVDAKVANVVHSQRVIELNAPAVANANDANDAKVNTGKP